MFIYHTFGLIAIVIPGRNLLSLTLILFSLAGFINANTTQIYDLRCEGLKNPSGIDVLRPHLSWKINSQERNQIQTAYQILVASSEQNLEANKGDLWDSEKVTGSESVGIAYSGQPLNSGKDCYWKVRIWDKHDAASAWSQPARWMMGIVDTGDWKARWIGLQPPQNVSDSAFKAFRMKAQWFRSEFTLEKKVKKAVACVTGVGLFEFYLNGQKISDHVLNPVSSEYDKRIYYLTYDVTGSLLRGPNAAGIVLGNGKRYIDRKHLTDFGLPAAICQIDVIYEDDSRAQIISNSDWKATAEGPIVFNSEYDGEIYDAREELTGWNEPGYDDSSWQNASVITAPSQRLAAQMLDPSRVTETLQPVAFNEPQKGVYVIDFGQNFSGWLRIRINEPRGAVVEMKFSELLKADGMISTDNLRTARATDLYIAKGSGEEIYEPRFTYHGFRYAEISGLSEKINLNDFEGRVVHDDLEQTGSFSTSNELINQIYESAVWSIRSNYHGIPLDCPQRDERQAWLGDRAQGSKGESYIFNTYNFYRKWLNDIKDTQKENGQIPNVAPTYWKVYRDNVTYLTTYIAIANLLYEQFADLGTVREHYPHLKMMMRYLQENYMNNHIIAVDQYGDWGLPPDHMETEHNSDAKLQASAEILATAYYYYGLKSMIKFSDLLEEKTDKEKFAQLSAQLKNALSEKLISTATLDYGNHSPTELILLLAFDLANSDDKSILVENLIGKMKGQYNSHIASGIIGMQWLMRVLSDNGNIELAYRLATGRSYPSWGYMLQNNATTIWEYWNGYFLKSQNHLMLLGDLMTWFYEYLGGIKTDDKAPGFKHIVMDPAVAGDLSFVSASYNSIYGTIKSEWAIKNQKFEWNITIPPNSSATIHVPAKKPGDVWEGRGKAIKSKDIEFVKMQNGKALFHIGSGHYSFAAPYKNPASSPDIPAPVIYPHDTLIQNTDKVLIRIQHPDEDATIHYTTDGSKPNKNSPVYAGPFEAAAYSRVRAVAFSKDNQESCVHSSNVDVYDPEINGWNYEYFEGNWSEVPDYEKLTPLKTGKTCLFELDKIKARPHHWGTRFKAVIDIPEDDEYTFYLSSDDGSKLYIDGKLVVNNDGIHYRTQKSGRIRLTTGRHPIMIEHFNFWSYNGLSLMFSGKNYSKQNVPLSRIFYE